jgi:pyruvate formate lyase activating enzyme
MNTNKTLRVAEIQHFCMHDGDGIRTTIFFKGCPLNCKWCHNPETKKYTSQLLFYKNKCMGCKSCETVCQNKAHLVGLEHTILREKCTKCFDCVKICPTKALENCGVDYSIEELIKHIEKDVAFYGNNGGVTLSGGEPFSQGPFLIELLKACKKRGINTAVETCGYANFELIKSAIEYVDTFLYDIKDTNETRHKEYTGVSNKLILENLLLVDSLGAKTRIRCILVNGVNTTGEHYNNIGKLAKQLANCQGVEFIPYHAYAGTKAIFIGQEDNGNKAWIPTEAQIEEAKRVVKSYNVKVF